MFEFIGFTTFTPFLIIIGIIVLCSIIGTYNGLVTSYKNIERSRSLVDVYLKKRFDLIPNLVECVKGYSKHEKETLAEVTKLRTSFAQEANQADADKLNNHYEKLIALAEAYPEIKAGENYLQLQKELADVESEISYLNDYEVSNISNNNLSVSLYNK